jgi:hypothetical protein
MYYQDPGDPALLKNARLNGSGDHKCDDCGHTVVRAFSILGGWMWLSLAAQGSVPAAQCPAREGALGFDYGAHRVPAKLDGEASSA